MESLTTISAMLSGKSITVPNYQRAYSWDTDPSNERSKQVNQFLKDLQDYISSHTTTPYYLGHFLFEERSNTEYAVIDGQQRLTTTVIFISAIYKRLMDIKGLKKIEDLDDDLYIPYCNTIKQRSQYRFSTVDYDNRMFRDYIIDHTLCDKNGLDTISKRRIADAFDYFCTQLRDKTENELLELLKAITQASCTTHVVKDESDAIQMFIFQNNRGKEPTNLEIIKAQFMYHIHLYAPAEDKRHILSEITKRFEHIYKSITKIEGNIDEDKVLNYTVKLRRNSIEYLNPRAYVNDELSNIAESISFIKDFVQSLASCFGLLSRFLEEAKTNFVYRSLLSIPSDRGIIFPFIVKAMSFNASQSDLESLAQALEKIFLRKYVIGTRADITTRLDKWAFQEMKTSVLPTIARIRFMTETRKAWWNYWNNDELSHALNMGMDHNVAKLLLWKYENLLRQEGKAGYPLLKYDDIEHAHLEHIAPLTENKDPDNGYCPYDEEFRNQYIECLGNYLLLSGNHNISLSNDRFQVKRDSYNYLQQQLEVQKMTEHDKLWDKEKIKARHEKIVEALMKVL